MRNWFVTALVLPISFVSLRADVTVVQTFTLEGAAAAGVGKAQMPRMTMRIKGQKSRADIEVDGQTTSSILDLSIGQVTVLDSRTKTATVTRPESAAAGGMPRAKADVSLKPTGRSQTIDGQQCDEHALSIRMNLADMTGPNLPAEALALMKDVRMAMDGSIWVASTAPGAAEYAAFHRTALASGLLTRVMGMAVLSGGFDQLLEAAASASGLPYLIDITMVVDGTGPMVEAMKQKGPVRLIQKVESVSTTAIADDIFNIPQGYTVEKK
jgi:hypothetical protein